MEDELNQFERPNNQSIIGIQCVFRNKVDEHGTKILNKARLVVKGFN